MLPTPTPDICQFWDTAALFSPVLVHQKYPKLAKIGQNIAFSALKKCTDLKKYTTAGGGGGD